MKTKTAEYRAAIADALAILHEIGWVGNSEQRIAWLADPPFPTESAASPDELDDGDE